MWVGNEVKRSRIYDVITAEKRKESKGNDYRSRNLLEWIVKQNEMDREE